MDDQFKQDNEVQSENYISVSGATSEQLKKYYQQRRGSQHSSFCSAPDINLYFGMKGEVYACCHSRNYVVGKWPDNSIGEIWKGEKLARLKAALKENKLSVACKICLSDLQIGNFEGVRANHFDQLPINPEFPTMMEFELDNTCNLQCVMCTGVFSSSIRKNRENLPAFQTNYSPEFVDQLEAFIPHLHTVRFSGGEPFLVELNLQIMQRITELNPKCLISVQTNGTILNERVKQLMHQGRFEIGVSVDSLVPETFAVVRKNGKLETVMANFEFFKAYCKERETALRISVCAMQQNWQELPDYLEFANTAEAYLCIHSVWHPQECSLVNFSSAKLSSIIIELRQVQFADGNNIERSNRQTYQAYLKQLTAWKDLASTTETTNRSAESKSVAELREDMISKIRTCIHSSFETDRQAGEKLTEVCIGRLTTLLKLLPRNQEKRLLVKMTGIEINVIVSGLSTGSVKELLQQALHFIKS